MDLRERVNDLFEASQAAHGYGAMFTLGLMDRYWKPDLTEAEATCIRFSMFSSRSYAVLLFEIIDCTGSYGLRGLK